MMLREAAASIAYKASCRTFQAGMKAANYALGYRIPDHIEGAGCSGQAARILKEHGAGRVFLVTDANIVKLGLLSELLKNLEGEGIQYEIFSDVAANPTSDNVEAGFAQYRAHPGQPLLAVGGGSPMDCAKAIAAKSVHPDKTVAQLQGVLKVHAKIPLFIAIPTTAGTGSETTVAAVITDSATHHKASINDPSILPAYAILDPLLTIGLPPKITATTGLDALCHAVEAYTNHTYNTELEDFLAKEAVRLIHDNLFPAYQDGSNLEARQNMQRAAFYAGRAFTRGCVGYVHAIGHTLGGLYGVPHGLAMSILLPHVLHQYRAAVYDRLADLADVCGIEGATRTLKAQNFIAWIEQMKRDMSIPSGIDCIRDEDVQQMIAWAMAEANPLYPTPIVWQEEDFQKLIDTVRSAKEN